MIIQTIPTMSPIVMSKQHPERVIPIRLVQKPRHRQHAHVLYHLLALLPYRKNGALYHLIPQENMIHCLQVNPFRVWTLNQAGSHPMSCLVGPS